MLYPGDLLCLQMIWSAGCQVGFTECVCLPLTQVLPIYLSPRLPETWLLQSSWLMPAGQWEVKWEAIRSNTVNQPAAAQGRATIQAKQCLRTRLYPSPWRVPREAGSAEVSQQIQLNLMLQESCRQGHFRDPLFFPGRV